MRADDVARAAGAVVRELDELAEARRVLVERRAGVAERLERRNRRLEARQELLLGELAALEALAARVVAAPADEELDDLRGRDGLPRARLAGDDDRLRPTLVHRAAHGGERDVGHVRPGLLGQHPVRVDRHEHRADARVRRLLLEAPAEAEHERRRVERPARDWTGEQSLREPALPPEGAASRAARDARFDRSAQSASSSNVAS